MMRDRAVLSLLLLGLMATGPAAAQDSKEGGSATDAMPRAPLAPLDPATQKSEMLDRLFGRLKSASNQEEASVIEQSIWQLWMKSDSATAELLLQQATKAMNARRYDKALDILDAVIASNPDYPEAWNKRATVNYLIGRLDRSLSDIDKVLEREPRHFGALAGLGMIRRDKGDQRGALEAFRHALAINPYMPKIREAVDDLQKQLEQGI